MRNRNDRILKAYIFIVLYSSVLKLILGRWGPLVSDIATVLVLLCSLKRSGRITIRFDKTINVVLVLVVGVQVISIAEIFHPNIQNTLYSLIEYRKSYFQLITLLAIYWTYRKSALSKYEIMRYIGVISVPIVLYGIKQYFWWGSIDSKLVDMTDANFYTMNYGGHKRSVSIFSGPFHYGMFCSMLLAIYIFLFCESNNKSEKKYYLVLAFISVAGSVCSITRTSLVCVIACICIWFLLYLRKKRDTKSISIKMIACFAAILAILTITIGIFDIPFLNESSSLGRMLSSLKNISGDNRFNDRTLSWQQGIRYICASPIFGYGIGSAADTMANYGISKIYLTVHNMFLKLLMEIGVIGGSLYILVFMICIWKAHKNNKESLKTRILSFSLFAIIMLNGLVGSTIASFPCLSLYWIVVGVLLCIKNTIG